MCVIVRGRREVGEPFQQSMRLGFINTVSALCYSMLIEEREPAAGEDCNLSPNAVVNFVLDQHERMPDYLRFPFLLFTIFFDLAGVVHGGTLFHRMEQSDRRRQIEAWRNSRFGLPRDFIRFYESLVVFCWYSMLSTRLGMLEQVDVAELEPQRHLQSSAIS
ncbi:MAG: hypothetical protein ACREVH_11715 [Gammaproteobacteria bacterium]